MEEKKFFLIVNPEAGAGKNDFPKIQEALKRQGLTFEYQFTQWPGEAGEITKRVLSGKKWDTIVAVGGDGTIKEVGSSLIGTGACLGIIPVGTANDLAKNLGISQDIEKAVQILKLGQKKKIDAIRIRTADKEDFAFNIIGIGFDGAVAELVQKLRVKKIKNFLCQKKYLRKLVYIVGALIKIFFFKNRIIEVATSQWSFKGSYLLLAICNGQSEGGYFKIAPQALFDDKMLDVCLIGKISRFNPFLRLYYMVKGLMGKHLSLPKVTYFKTQFLKIFSQEPLICHFDGEPKILTGAIEIEVIPAALEVISGKIL
jgi:YegS/Rv2252/BmrU family lipid kinase